VKFKFLIYTLIFFIASLIQVSFLPHFGIAGVFPNLIFILFFIFLLENSQANNQKQYYQIFFLIAIAGLFSDIFSPYSFGISIFVLCAVYYFKEIITHFFSGESDKDSMLYFMAIFLACFFVNNIIFNFVLSLYGDHKINYSLSLFFVNLIYNSVLAAIGFYIYKKVNGFTHRSRQLKLL